MKKLAILITAALFFNFLINIAFAQVGGASPTSEPVSPTLSTEDNEVKVLKEKIATKVAELRQKNNRAISGTVVEINDNVIKIKTPNDKDFNVKLDEALTKYYQITGAQKIEVKLKDVKKDSYILVSGVISDSKIDANAVYLDEYYLVKSGKVTEVDKENYFIKVITTEKDNFTLDVETYTKQLLLNIKTLAPEAIGFSKIKEGDTIQFVVKKTDEKNEPMRYSARKILLIPQEYFMK